MKNRLKRAKEIVIFVTQLLMMFYFVNEGLDLVDLDQILPQGLEILLLVTVSIGAVLMLIKAIQDIGRWKRRTQPLPRPSFGVLFVLALFLILFASVPIVVMEHWGERIIMYLILIYLVAMAVLHRYYEIE